MKRIVCHFRAGNSLRGALFALLALGAVAIPASAAASTRPRRGGTLRVQISGRIDAMDPRMWPSSAEQAAIAERLDGLVFDRLIRLDERGELRPALAISWQHDDQAKRWQFRLREGVNFSDGVALTPPIAAMALQQLLGASFDVSATADSVVIQSEHSLPDLPAELATGRYFIFHTGDSNSLAGTGPFKQTTLESVGRAAQLVFVANDTCWAGRPFVDGISVSMNVDIAQQANAIAFGQADIVELPASEVRRAAQRGVRTASSDPVELLALVFDASRPVAQDALLRQAISLAIDRASIADVILQRQGIAAGALLPNWISGYAHLLPATSDAQRARELLASSARQLSHAAPLVLFYDSSDAEARAAADRVAVNLREVGIAVQVSGQVADGKSKAPVVDVRLKRFRLDSPDPSLALAGVLKSLGEDSADLGTLEQMFAAERAPVEAFRVIPLAHVSESYGLSPRVRDWIAPRWGGWDLADVWLAPQPAAGGNSP
jgi:peptide/nickel transport system substrate-binding protein